MRKLKKLNCDKNQIVKNLKNSKFYQAKKNKIKPTFFFETKTETEIVKKSDTQIVTKLKNLNSDKIKYQNSVILKTQIVINLKYLKGTALPLGFASTPF